MPKVFPNVEELTRVRIENVTCEIVGCGKRFKHSLALRFHIVKVHNIVKNDSDNSLIWKGGIKNNNHDNEYHCPIPSCIYNFKDHSSKYFTSFKLLRQHYNSVHGDKRHQCQNCKSMFSRKSDLNRHMGYCEERTCQSCKIRMSDSKSLEQHCLLLNHQLPSTNRKNFCKKKLSQFKKTIKILPKTSQNIDASNSLSILPLNNFLIILPTENSHNTKANTNSHQKLNNLTTDQFASINLYEKNKYDDKSYDNSLIALNSDINSSQNHGSNNNIELHTNILINNENNIENNTTDFMMSKLVASSSSFSSCSSYSSSTSPLYKAVEIQTMGLSKKNKKSQGSQVVAKKKRFLLTENNQTQTIPFAPKTPIHSQLFSTFTYPITSPVSYSNVLNISTSTTISHSIPAFSSIQTQTSEHETYDHFKSFFERKDLESKCSESCVFTQHCDSINSYDLSFGNSMNYNMKINMESPKNNLLNATNVHLEHLQGKENSVNNLHSVETQTNFSWPTDDFKYLEDILNPLIPSECFISTETQTTNTDLPDLSDICDLLDTSDITTQTPLFLHTEEAHTQTYN